MYEKSNYSRKDLMENTFIKKIDTIPILMMIYIACQPILDLFTSFSKIVLEWNFTPGIIIRFAFIIIGCIYILISAFKNKKRQYICYLFILASFFIINLAVSSHYKPIFNLKSEIIAIGKIIYFIVMFFVFILSFQNLKRNDSIVKFFPENIVISQFIIGLSMFVSEITGTNIEAYDGILKSGNSGWYFAANELGALLAICYPILIWFSLKQISIKKIILSWVIVVSSSYSLVAIGTKVGYL